MGSWRVYKTPARTSSVPHASLLLTIISHLTSTAPSLAAITFLHSALASWSTSRYFSGYNFSRPWSRLLDSRSRQRWLTSLSLLDLQLFSSTLLAALCALSYLQLPYGRRQSSQSICHLTISSTSYIRNSPNFHTFRNKSSMTSFIFPLVMVSARYLSKARKPSTKLENIE